MNQQADNLAKRTQHQSPIMKDEKFNTGEPLGYFITWTACGTWLPGDDRGWQKKGDAERQMSNALFQDMAQAAMKETTFYLTPGPEDC